MGNTPSSSSRASSPSLHDVGQSFELRRVKLTPSHSDTVDLGEIWATLRDNKRIIFGSAAAVLAVVLAVTLVSRMSFKTFGSLYLGEVQQKTGGVNNAEGFDFLQSPQGELGTEIEILKSDTLVTRAVLESGMNVSLTPYGWSAPRYWKWRVQGRDPNLIADVSREVVAQDTQLSDTVRKPQAYRVRFVSATEYELWSEPSWIAKTRLADLLSERGWYDIRNGEPKRLARGKLGEPLRVPELQLKLAKGTAGTPKAGTEYSLRVQPLEDVLDSVRKELNVVAPKAGPGSAVSVVRVEYSAESPVVARSFLDRLLHGYLEQRQTWKTEEASAAETFVTNQLRGMRESLDKAEKDLANYKESSGVVVLSDEAKAMIEQLGSFEQQRVAAQLEASALKDIQRKLKKGAVGGAPLEAYLMGEAQDTVLAGMGQSLTKAQEELKRLEQQFTPDAPAVKDQQAQVDAQLQMIRSYVNTRSSRAQQQLGSISGVINQFENKLKNVPRAELELAQLGRHTEVLSRVYSYLLERQQQAAIVKAATISDNRILDLPKVPHREDQPQLLLRVLLSSLIGLLMGTLYVFGRRRLSATFQSAAAVRTRFEAVPIFSVIPKRFETSKLRKLTSRKQPHIRELLSDDPRSGFAESFRLLRANIYRAAPRGGCKVILVTSPNPGDGKSLCSLGLAATLAADGSRVLLIDGDLHKPSHHKLMNLFQEPGLNSVLRGQSSWRDVLNPVPLNMGELHAITAGEDAPSSAESFSSIHAANFFGEVRRFYDYVVIDSPSFPLVSDPLIMSMYADRVLTVIRPKNTRRDASEEHLRRLSAMVPCAVVINDADGTEVTRYGYTPFQLPAPPTDAKQGRSKQARAESSG